MDVSFLERIARESHKRPIQVSHAREDLISLKKLKEYLEYLSEQEETR